MELFFERLGQAATLAHERTEGNYLRDWDAYL